MNLARQIFACIIIIFLALTLTGCLFISPLQTMNDAVNRNGMTITHDVAYGVTERQKLDIYAPKNASNAPVIVFVHGGSWRNGGREDYPFLGETFTTQGYVMVVISYRLSPQTIFPGWMNDAALAVKWTKDNIIQYGGNPNRISLMGHSAGAHIVALLGADESYLQAVDLNRSAIQSVVGLAGPYDFIDAVRQSVGLRETFGVETNWFRAMPVNVVDGFNPPMLLLQGLKDTTVEPRNASSLEAAIKAKNGRIQVITYASLGHTEILGVLSKSLGFLEPKVLSDILAFLK